HLSVPYWLHQLVVLTPLPTRRSSDLQLDEDTVPIMNGVELPGGLIPFLAQDASLTLDRAVALDDRDQLLAGRLDTDRAGEQLVADRKSTRLNSSHVSISYAVFCLKKK